MKKTFITVCMLLVSMVASAQFYISGSFGYSLSTADVRLGTTTTLNGEKVNYGTYGEGLQTQFRTGYFFNEKWGVELGFGYLDGADQNIMNVSGIPTQPEVDLFARGRAYGASLSAVYNITENFYGRAGLVTKVAGRTELVGSIDGVALPAGSLPGVGVDTTLDVDFVHDFEGRFPLGFIGAIGYKHKLSDHVALFGEVEYLGISVTRDVSTMSEFDATIRETGTSLGIDTVRAIFLASDPNSAVAALFHNNINYVDELPLGNTDATKQLSVTAPYSSFGVNFGITYTF